MAIGYKGLDGLYKTIYIATFQTICQIKQKYHQTNIFPNHGMGIYGYIGYRGYKGLSKYRRIPPISLYEINVSNTGQGAQYGRVYKEYPLSLLAYIRHMQDMRIYGLMV